MKRRRSLAFQNAWRLTLVFVLFELLAAAAVVFLLMLPMARRAAADLAGLMVLSAQTWSELPPETRPAFAAELERAHALELREQAPEGPPDRGWTGPYLDYLDVELQQRTSGDARMSLLFWQDESWHWVRLPSGEGHVWVGFPSGRVGPQPMMALTFTLLVSLLLAFLAARWLAGRSAEPLRRLDAAALALGRGEMPELLPETGPTELAGLAGRFNAMARQVRELLEARTTLLAGISHDLRTPLARMRLALEMIERRPEPRWIERLDADIEEMNGLVGELLDLAKGLVKEAPIPIELGQLLGELAEPLRQAGIAIDVRANAATVRASSSSLRRVLTNLLENARRYGGGWIELRAESSGDGCRIGVLDRGPGIPDEQMESVFRPFHRVEGSRSVETGGSGLGLAIVRQLAQANDWQVKLENREGGGLAAWLLLPLACDVPVRDQGAVA